MENLEIEKNRYSPEILFKNSGRLSIKGFSLLENSLEIYFQALQWLENFRKELPCSICLDLKFEAIDTSSVRSVANMVKILNTFPAEGFRVQINWFYEKDDEDLYETGEGIQSVARIEFNLVEKQIEDLDI